jgi:hypothetical protein
LGGEEGGEGVVEIAGGVVGAAEGTFCEDLWAVLEVEKAGLDVHEAGAEGLVVLRQGIVGSDEGEAVEEDVDGDLEAGLGRDEDVLGAEEGGGPDEEEEDGGGEEDEAGEDVSGEGDDGLAVEFLGAADGLVVGDGFGEEDGAEEDGEGANAGGGLLATF